MSKSAWASFAPTPAELAYSAQIFEKGDPQRVGIITGDAAVPIFAGSDLPPDKLGEIWAISDHDDNGYLTKKGVAAAVRLIAWAQRGETVSEALLSRPGPLPTISGVRTPGNSLDVANRTTSPSPFVPSTGSLPPLAAPDRLKFSRLFVSSGPANGLLSGDKARDVFLKSHLPVEKLGQIWTLADTRNAGALDSTDFAIGMHLIQTCMKDPSYVLPTSLPPGLYEQASGGKPFGTTPALNPQTTGGSVGSPSRSSFGPLSGLNPQYTGQRALQPQGTGSLRPQFTGQSVPSSSPAVSAFPSAATSAFSQSHQQWDVSLEEKAKADGFFDTLDKQRRGYIEGDVAVPFMLESKLQEGDLAQIWDLADLNNDGKLTKEGFAIALHIINEKLAGKSVPATLPLSLVPPNMRTVGATHAPNVTAPAPQSQIQRDLWGLDDEDNRPLAASLPAGSRAAPVRSPSLPPVSSPPPGAFSPFQTAFQTTSSAVSRPAPDLLSDDEEPEPASRSPPSANQSLAIANAKNQLQSTQRSLSTAQSDKAQMEAAVADSAAQLSQIQSQLASAKAQFETETRLVSDLQARQQDQAGKIKTNREELIHAESELSALRAEKAEIEGSVLRDKEEIRDLQSRLKIAGDQAIEIKAEVEKVKKDARQQKGLLAIAKKQLATAEEAAQSARVAFAAAQEELANVSSELSKTNEETARVRAETPAGSPPTDVRSRTNDSQTNAAVAPFAIPLPGTPDILSPVPSAKSNNPFGRLTGQNTGSLPGSPSFHTPAELPAAVETHDSNGVAAGLVGDSSDPFDTAFGITDTPKGVTDTDSQAAEVPEATEEVDVAQSFDGPQPQIPALSDPPAQPTVGPELRRPTQASTSESMPAVHTAEAVPVEGSVGPVVSEEAPPAPKDKVPADDEDSSDDEGVEEAIGRSKPALETTSGGAEPTLDATSAKEKIAPTPELPADALFGTSSTDVAEVPHSSEKADSEKSEMSPETGKSPFASTFSTLEDTAPLGRTTSSVDTFNPNSGASSGDAFGIKNTKPFTFEQSFEDTFDFDGTTSPTQEVQKEIVQNGNAHVAPASALNSFDDAFGFGKSSDAPAPNQPESNTVETPSTLPPPPPVSRSGTTRRQSRFGISTAANGTTPGLPARSSTLRISRENSPTPSPGRPIFSSPSNTTPSFTAAPQTATPVVPPAAETSNAGLSFDDAFGIGPDIPPFDARLQSAVYPTPSPRSNVNGGAVTSSTTSTPALPPRARAPDFSNPRPVSNFAAPSTPEAGADGGSDARPTSPSVDRSHNWSPPPGSSHKDEGSGKGKSKLASFFGRNKHKDKGDKDSKSSRKRGGSVTNTDEFGSGAPATLSHGSAARVPRYAPTGDVIGNPVNPDDDVAAVKRLVDMGFTRAQAVDALERNSYDVPAALNSLLGSA